MNENLIFNKSVEERGTDFINSPLKDIKTPEHFIPKEMLRDKLKLPSLGELDVIRHYTKLSRLNFGVDTHFYPLGSCTMKYNPKINEDLAHMEDFTYLHPYQNENLIQGALAVIYELEKILSELTGMKRFTFQPSAGAHGEFAGMLIIKAFHTLNSNRRSKVLIPDSAHGTNPASAAMCGYKVEVIKSTKDGLVDTDELKSKVDAETAALMLTNPNTLGLFEERIMDISQILHKKGALLYYDGANFNPLMGIVKPRLMGFDVMHLNLHKTFSTPHGSGGPGAAAVGVSDNLVDFLPVPLVDKKENTYYFNYSLKHSIGKIKPFYGNFLVFVKAYSYLLRLGRNGLKRAAYNCVLNANYIRTKLKREFVPASDKMCMHEVVFSCAKQKERGASALDIAKRLIDFGIHPPTMYFPHIVREALMVEPTETESKETLDYFIDRMIKINEETKSDLKNIKEAPHNTPVRRPDEVRAARFPDLRWKEHGE